MSEQPTLYFMHELVMEPGPPVIRFVPVKRCEHGNIDPHELGHVNPPWCPGSPTLREADHE